MDLKGIPIEKLFTQQEVYQRIAEYQKKVEELRKERFYAQAKSKEEAKELRDSGLSRIVFTDNPRGSVSEVPEPEEEEKPKLLKKVKKLIKESVEPIAELMNETVEEPIDDTMLEVEIPEVVLEACPHCEGEFEDLKTHLEESCKDLNGEKKEVDQYQEVLREVDTEVEARKLEILEKKKALLEQIAELEKQKE